MHLALRRRTLPAAATLVAALFAAAPAVAADIEAGRRFAEDHCARCHAVGTSGESPHAGAPPFRQLAERWPLENLAEALAEGITVGHPDMPEFVLSPEEIDDLLGYLESISEAR
jgi:mono/diheme cytochrome c family protein